MRFSRPGVVLCGVLAIALALAAPISGQRTGDAPAPLASFSEPAISPDRSEIAVVSGGDIWTVPAAGGDARLLVAHEATESRPDLLARRPQARLHFRPHRRRRHLRPRPSPRVRSSN